MHDFNLNALWCRVIIDELLHSGLRHAVICPGGRSAVMAIMLQRQACLETIVHTDERSGAFIALGIAQSTHRPVVICTTSGSAVGNLVPALMEAHAAAVPLILLTCDRPRHQRGAGVPQSTDHIATCAPFVRASVDLYHPDEKEDSLLSLRHTISSLLPHCKLLDQQGPIHINIPLLAKLCTTEIDPDWQLPKLSPTALYGRQNQVFQPLPFIPLPDAETPEVDISSLTQQLGLKPGLRGLIVAAWDCPLSPAQVTELTTTTGYPVLADAPSNLRRPAIPNLICEADALVLSPQLATYQAELIIRLGSAPISHTMQNFLMVQQCPVLRIDRQLIQRDFLHTSFQFLRNPSDEILEQLANVMATGDRQWLEFWQQEANQARQHLQNFVESLPWSESKAVALVCAVQGFDLLHLANSMSIRHGNFHCVPKPWTQRIFANRGVNGIDGVIGSFLGELKGSRQPGLLMIGDQAMLHDLPALEAASDEKLHGCICIINNGGGAIFDLLDCVRLPDYQETIRNPNGVNFAHCAAAFNLEFRRCHSIEELDASLKWSQQKSGVQIIEACVSKDSLRLEFLSLYQATLGIEY